MNIAKSIIEKMGGAGHLARGMGVSLPTISYWMKRGYIPVLRHVQLLELAEEEGIVLRHEELLREREKMLPELEFKDYMKSIDEKLSYIQGGLQGLMSRTKS